MDYKYHVADASRFANGSSGVFPVTSMTGIMPINEMETAKAFKAGLNEDAKNFLINHEAFKGQSIRRGDAIENGSLFFSRALEIYRAKPFEVEYADLKFRKVLDVTNEGGPGAMKITSEVYDIFGKASIINGGLSKDVSLVAGGGKEISFPIVRWGIGAAWTIQELQSFTLAQKNGHGRQSPEQVRQRAALRGIEQSLNEQFFFGVPDVGSFGFVNHPLVPTGPAAAGTSGSTLWSKKTPDEILADIIALGNVVYANSLMKERPDHLALAPASLQLLRNTRITNYSGESLLSFIMKNNQWFNKEESFIDLNELTGASYDGNNKAVAYTKNVDKANIAIPMEPQALPVQQNYFSYLMLWMADSAGLNLYYPRSMAYLEGI